MKKESQGSELALIPAIMVGAAGLALAVNEVLLRTVWSELPKDYPYGLAAAVGIVPAWMLTDTCFRQQHTYDAEIYRRRPFLIVPAWLFFLSIMLLLTGGVLGVPAWAIVKALVEGGKGNRGYPLAVLPLALVSLAVSISALSRGVLLWSLQRHVEQLATSAARSAAAGLVELRGTALPIEGPGGVLFGQIPPAPDIPARPFFLEDATGRIRVEPPAVSIEQDPRFAAKHHPHTGLPVLESGDPVLVVGAVREDPERPGELRVTPWTPAGLPFGTRLLSRPEIFLLVCGNETHARRRLFRTRLGWLALGGLLTAGALVATAASAAALVHGSWLGGFAVFAR